MIEKGKAAAPSRAGDACLLDEVAVGLKKPQKELPCKFFYDEKGSALFDRICELEEYYPTRTELDIMSRNVGRITESLGPEVLLIELGSGSSIKTHLLLDHLQRQAGYIPVDISAEHLEQSVNRLQADYPALPIVPLAADYTRPLDLPEWKGSYRRKVIYFPGSTVGNFTPEQARAFLIRMARIAGTGGGLLIGVDLKKDLNVLHAAYNDREGVTAAFNLNILAHLNRRLGLTFDLKQWSHQAFYNSVHGRIEMHLVSRVAQQVHVDGSTIHFAAGETILTEYSYKYSIREVARLVSGIFDVQRVWTDVKEYFSVQYLTVS